MPGVEVVHPTWTPSRNGHLNGTDSPGHEKEGQRGGADSPRWSGSGRVLWPTAHEADQDVAHMALQGQYANNPSVSSHLDSRVDGLPRSDKELTQETALGHSRSLREQRVFKPHKPLPRRRHFSDNAVNLRSQFNTTGSESSVLSDGDRHAPSMPSPTTPVMLSSTHSLLPTPPSVQHDVMNEYDFEESSNAETTILRSRIVTPAPQQSPPTPDNTPPRLDPPPPKRHLLGTQPSLASTKAESFQTAREHISSDDDDDDENTFPGSILTSGHPWRHARPPTNDSPVPLRQSPLAHGQDAWDSPGRTHGRHNEVATPPRNRKMDRRRREPISDAPSPPTGSGPGVPPGDSEYDSSRARPGAQSPPEADPADPIQPARPQHASPLTPPTSSTEYNGHVTPDRSGAPAEIFHGDAERLMPGRSLADAANEAGAPRRGQSLRERLEQAQRIDASPSTELFGDEIGWSRPAKAAELKTRINSWRLSGISTASTVEAIVVDREPKRQQTLRHRGRQASLRSASSPTPASNRTSLLSNPESPPRLHHKKARLSNQNRWSFGSEISRSLSMSSAAAAAAAAPPPKAAVVRVAVIPERASSRRSSATSSQRHSALSSAASGGHRSVKTDGRNDSVDLPRHRRAVSDSFSSALNFANRGRDRRGPPLVPARSSSLSAPTSQSNSRANSMTSEHLRLRRVAAEEDVRKTLANMESARTDPTEPILAPPVEQRRASSAERDADQWATMRPPSAQQTPFSQQSFHSASPGVVEMGEARAVNLFPHNNHSLQLIESNPLAESRAVQELYTSARHLQLMTDEPTTPVASLLPMLAVDSPLRNPRDPPKPPQFKVIPPTPASLTPIDDHDRPLGTKHPLRKGSGRRFGSLRRPSLATRRYSESFVKSFGRSLSLNAKNTKADQDLDSALHPFWRPRGFWDEFSESDEDGARAGDREVSNSLGLPQKRTIIDGPLSLVRKISDGSRRRRQKAGVAKRASYSSLSRFRMGRKIHTVPGLGLRFQVLGFRDVQQRMLSVKRRKDDERRDRRREELRRSIGPNVISQGDSRYISPRLMAPSSGLTPDVD